jgi:predicted CXXCH cytochrome family protein
MKIHAAVSIALALALFSAVPASAASCVTTACHADFGSLKRSHEPVKENQCDSCHIQRGTGHPIKGTKTVELNAKGAALCTGCHEMPAKKKYQHDPVKEGDCVSCHNPHGSNEKYLLPVGGDRTPLCLKCHEAAPFKQNFMHGPAAVGACNACHNPHDANEESLMKGPVRDVCLGCHADFSDILKASAFVHPPVAKGPCTSCHNPHGSPVKYFLHQKTPDLCVGCHKEMKKKLQGVKHPHKPVLQAGGCTSCHSAHYSKAKRLLSADEMTVCLGCHGTDDLGTPPLRNIKTQIEGKKYLHGPIKKGECTACHDPHGTDYFRMLPGNYPSTLYAPYKDGEYGACLKCHEKNLLRFPETTIYTGFRNGNKNLHYVHVVSRKGRSCRICHQPHGSDGEKLIDKDGAQFGEWKIPINFVKTPTGGSCAPGCHKMFRYDRQKALDNGTGP